MIRVADMDPDHALLVTHQDDVLCLVVNEYQIVGGGPHDDEDWRLCRRRQSNDVHLWAIYRNSLVLNRDGELEYEPLPSSRDDEFYARCRFDTPAEAMTVYLRTTQRKEDA